MCEHERAIWYQTAARFPMECPLWVKERWGMVGRCVQVSVCSFALCFGACAVAQERGKVLYATQCERCHKSPQSVTTFHGGLDLKTFLGEAHYSDSPESAASIAAYLKEVEQAAQRRSDEPAKKRRRTKQRGEADFPPPPTQHLPTSANPGEENPVGRAIRRLFPWGTQ